MTEIRISGDGANMSAARFQEPLMLQDLCVRIVADGARTYRGWIDLADKAEYFQTEKCAPIMKALTQQAISIYPLLREKYGLEVLKERYGWIDWETIIRRYEENELEKRRFLQMKGEVLDRSVVEYDASSTTFPYAVLKAGVSWPPTVNPTKREQYLSDEEFPTVFKMTREEFLRLPRFKRDNLKKDLQLF